MAADSERACDNHWVCATLVERWCHAQAIARGKWQGPGGPRGGETIGQVSASDVSPVAVAAVSCPACGDALLCLQGCRDLLLTNMDFGLDTGRPELYARLELQSLPWKAHNKPSLSRSWPS